MKRALKKRVKAVLKNTPSDDAPVEQLNMVNPKANRRARTKAAMIGLAISMGATSLLVTRQSDQAQATAPIDSQKAASTMPVASNTDMKFAPKQGTTVLSSASMPENPVVVEPTAISQLPGLEAKWQVLASGMSVQVPASETFSGKVTANKTSIQQQLLVAPEGQVANQLQQLPSVDGQAVLPANKPQQAAVDNTIASGEINAQLKAQQEFALNRLQEKSNRLRKGLSQLRSDDSKNLSQAAIGLTQPTTVLDKVPQVSASNTVIENSPTAIDANQAELISRLKQTKTAGVPIQPATITPPVIPQVVASLNNTTYEVKPGDTLAAIASRYKTSVAELVKANNLNNPNQLKISQKLIIPAARSVAAQTPVQYGSEPQITTPTENAASLNPSLPMPSQPSVLADNSVTVPTPTTTDNQVQQVQVNTVPEQAPSKDESYGVGGDTPVPTAFAEIQLHKKPTESVVRAKNERLRSLQEEIQRLQAKYRAQQSGNLNAAVPGTTTESDNAAVPIPVAIPNNFAVSKPTSQQKDFAVPIAVPNPLTSNYSNQPVKPEFRATLPVNEPVNPEFLSNQPVRQLTPSRNTSATRIATPPIGVDASNSLGRMRGTTVSPQFPPLAAVDQYLPKPIDETIPPPSTSSVAYMWPAKGVLTSGYGWRWGRMHRGIDVANSVGTPIYASADGVVEKAGWNKGGYGNLVDIRHADGSITRYGHNSRILVQAGQQVHQGQTIAEMGSTGFSTGPHSHFEIHPSGKGAVNPIAMLPKNRV